MKRSIMAIALLACAATLIAWAIMTPRLARYPLAPDVVAATEVLKSWTINSESVGSELMFRPGEKLSFSVHLDNDVKSRRKIPSARKVTPDYSKVYMELAFRFVQQGPCDEDEIHQNSSTLHRQHPRGANEPYMGNWYAPKRLGDYQLQLVIYHVRLGDFAISPDFGGEVLGISRVHIVER